MKSRINTDGFEGYAKGALERARKLDRRNAIKPEITITFEDPLAMVDVITAERLRLVRKVRTKSLSITALAAMLKRDDKSVRRDVLKLERAGVVLTREQINPGRGKREDLRSRDPQIPPYRSSLNGSPSPKRQFVRVRFSARLVSHRSWPEGADTDRRIVTQDLVPESGGMWCTRGNISAFFVRPLETIIFALVRQ